jgi:hypothetical protein
MGLLDDAIREHLELKRRRGADPGEVAREQREALEPVPRTRVAEADEDAPVAEDDAAVATAPPSAEPPVGAAGVAPVGALPVQDDLIEAPQPQVGDVAADVGETAELDMRSVLGDGRGELQDQDETAPPQSPEGEHARAAAEIAPLEEDSLEWEVPGDVPNELDAADEEGEDVLEETPDFLRDTPEQERLWFEQRPPRDFDFDR